MGKMQLKIIYIKMALFSCATSVTKIRPNNHIQLPDVKMTQSNLTLTSYDSFLTVEHLTYLFLESTMNFTQPFQERFKCLVFGNPQILKYYF